MAQNKTGEFRVGRGLTDHVYVDVDGTLVGWRGHPAGSWDTMPQINSRLVGELQKWKTSRPVGTIVVWSTGGKDHAQRAIEYCGLDAIAMAKPDIAVDDGLSLKVLAPEEFVCPAC